MQYVTADVNTINSAYNAYTIIKTRDIRDMVFMPMLKE